MFPLVRKHVLVLASCCIAAAIIVVAAGGCSSSSTPGPTATSTPASLTEALPAAGQPLQFPPHAGFSGSEVVPPNNAPAGTTVTLTSYTKLPASAPAPQGAARRGVQSISPALPAGSTVVFVEQEQFGNVLTFDDFPMTSITLASSVSTSSNTFLLETIDGTSGILLVSQPQTQVDGQTVTFGAVSADFDVNTSDTYWLEVIAEPVTQPSPSPSPSVAPSPSPSVKPSPSPSPSVKPSPSPSVAPSPSPSVAPSPSPSPSASPCNEEFGPCTITLTPFFIGFPDVPPAQWGCGGNPYVVNLTASESGYNGNFTAVGNNTQAATMVQTAKNAWTFTDIWQYPNGQNGPSYSVIVSDTIGNASILFVDFNAICLP